MLDESKFENRFLGSCAPTALFVLVFVVFLAQNSQMFGWHWRWRLHRCDHSHGALKSAVPCGVAAPCGPRHDDSLVLVLAEIHRHNAFRVTRHRARVLDLADKEPWWDKGVIPVSEENGYGDHL